MKSSSNSNGLLFIKTGARCCINVHHLSFGGVDVEACLLHTVTKMVEYAEYVKRILSRKVGSIGMKGEESEEGETTES